MWRTIELFRCTGQVAKKPYPKENASRKLTAPAQHFILHLVLDNPGIYLHEIQAQLKEQLLLVNVSTICRFLHSSGFTRQRICTTALQQDGLLRQQYMLDLSLYSPEMLVFVDETGTDRRYLMRKYGYSL